MIRDAQNTFGTKINLATDTVSTNVIHVGGGDAVNQMYLYVNANTAIVGTGGSISLETSDAENFGTKTVLGTYPLSTGVGEQVKARLPIGCKKYLRLAITKGSITAGTVIAYLAYDVNIR